MNIVFKVVCVKNSTGRRYSAWLTHEYGDRQFPFGDFYLEYPKEEIVKAPKKSLGIMCFKNHNDAVGWCNNLNSNNDNDDNNYIVIEVSYDCEPKIPRFIFNAFALDLYLNDDELFDNIMIREFFPSKNHSFGAVSAPMESTICLESVFCLT